MPNPTGKRKQKVMESAPVLNREQYNTLEREARIGIIRQLIPLGLMAVAEELQREVDEMVGGSNMPQSLEGEGIAEKVYRYGTNPGSVVLGNQRVPIRVPRLRTAAGEVILETYKMLHTNEPSESLYQSILNGVSCRNYETTVEEHPGSICKSKSTASRQFMAASAKRLRSFQQREISQHDIIAIFIDGKTFADDKMVIVLGIGIEGSKHILGFVQTTTENGRVISSFLQSLMDRGLRIDQGILCVVDGAKGLISAIKQAFSKKVVIQRCQWHKRENVVSYLSKSEQASLRSRLQHAYDRPTYDEAYRLLKGIQDDLSNVNQSAARSLEEGLKDTLALHKLGLFAKMGRSFKTTNCIESINSMAEDRCGKVDRWKNSSQRERWLASALLDIEPHLRRVDGRAHLPELRIALKKELGIQE